MLDKFEIGSPEYVIGPNRKALWECSYKFSALDLEVIYRTALTHQIAFGNAVYALHLDGLVLFECWGPATYEAISAYCQDTLRDSWMWGKRIARAREAAEVFRRQPAECKIHFLVSLAKPIDTSLWPAVVGSHTQQGPTYAEAIEQGIFESGLDKLSVLSK